MNKIHKCLEFKRASTECQEHQRDLGYKRLRVLMIVSAKFKYYSLKKMGCYLKYSISSNNKWTEQTLPTEVYWFLKWELIDGSRDVCLIKAQYHYLLLVCRKLTLRIYIIVKKEFP